MKPTTSNRFVRAVSASLLCLHGVASAVDYNIDTFTGGTYTWNTDSIWSPDATGGSGPLGADNIVISGDISTADTTINYASGTAANRSIGNITVTDTNNVSGSSRGVVFAPGVAASTLTFNTTTPTVSTNIGNIGASGQKLTISNPLFQSATTFTKGGTGNVRLDFITTGSASGFATNVNSVTSAGGGDLWLTNSSGASMALLLGGCFLREAPEGAIGSDRRAGKWGLAARRLLSAGGP